jgi:hypothetical protein
MTPRSHIARALLIGLVGCASTSFDGSLFSKRQVAYRVGELGPDWKRVELEDADLAFTAPGKGSIGVHASCRNYDDVPQSVLLNHLLFGTTHREYRLEEEVTLDGRGARHAVVEAELDGVPIRLDLYVLTRSGCVFDLSYVSGTSAPAAAEFERFVQGFHVEEVRRE